MAVPTTVRMSIQSVHHPVSCLFPSCTGSVAAVPASEPAKKASAPRRRLSLDADMGGRPPVVFPLPMTRDEAVTTAVEGIQRAWADGATFFVQI